MNYKRIFLLMSILVCGLLHGSQSDNDVDDWDIVNLSYDQVYKQFEQTGRLPEKPLDLVDYWITQAQSEFSVTQSFEEKSQIVSIIPSINGFVREYNNPEIQQKVQVRVQALEVQYQQVQAWQDKCLFIQGVRLPVVVSSESEKRQLLQAKKIYDEFGRIQSTKLLAPAYINNLLNKSGFDTLPNDMQQAVKMTVRDKHGIDINKRW